MLQLARSSKYLLTKKFDLFIFMHTELYIECCLRVVSLICFFTFFEKMRHESEAARENNAIYEREHSKTYCQLKDFR